jgi:hypothetical protein
MLRNVLKCSPPITNHEQHLFPVLICVFLFLRKNSMGQNRCRPDLYLVISCHACSRVIKHFSAGHGRFRTIFVPTSTVLCNLYIETNVRVMLSHLPERLSVGRFTSGFGGSGLTPQGYLGERSESKAAIKGSDAILGVFPFPFLDTQLKFFKSPNQLFKFLLP